MLLSYIFGPSVVKYDILSNNRHSKLHAVTKTANFFAEGAELLSVHYEVCYGLDNCTSDLVQKNAVHHCFSFKQLKALAKYWFTLEVLRIMVEVLGNLLVVFASRSDMYT